METDLRQEERKKNFKASAGIDLTNDRAEYALKLRKNKRENDIQSKRMVTIAEYADVATEEEFEKTTLTAFVQREPLLGSVNATIVFAQSP